MTTLLALLIAVQPAPALVEKADQASQAYIGCLFATSREAHGSRLPLAEFKRKLAKACQAEERLARAAATRLLAERGEPNPAASAERMMSDARRSVAATYESLPRIESQLEELAEICRQQPDECR